LHIAICGIGQWFRGDDAIGLAAVKAWAQAYPSAADQEAWYITAPLSQLPEVLMESDAIILVDAVQSGRPIGSISVIKELADLKSDSFMTTSHGLGVAEIFRLLAPIIDLPSKPVILIGIEIQNITLGTPLSDDLVRRIPSIVDLIAQTCLELGKDK
jgi:hydrogenase maturation protease